MSKVQETIALSTIKAKYIVVSHASKDAICLKGLQGVTTPGWFSCKKYNTKVMGHVFEVEWWEKHPSGCRFWFIMDKEIGKDIGKRKRGNKWNFIYENKGKYEKGKVKCHIFSWEGNWRNNRGKWIY